MQITVSGHGIEVTASLRDYVHDKFGKMEEYFKNIQKIEVVLDARANENVERRHVAEVRAWMAGLKMIQALGAGRDMYAALDLAFNETKRQIEKHKEMLGHEKIRKSRRWKLLSRLKIPGINLFGGSKEL